MSSRGSEILISVTRDAGESLTAQIERQIRDAVRSGALRPGAAVPSTRDLARDLDVSRPMVMEAYAQLAAEGYLALRQGAAPRVSELVPRPPVEIATAATPGEQPRYDFRTGTPDLQSFPRTRWARATAAAMRKMESEAFGYAYRHGAEPLRQTLADYLGRVRGVSADPRQILIVGGFDQSRSFISETFARGRIKRIAVEDPGYSDRGVFLDRGFELIPVPVDDDGILVDALAQTGADAVLLTPAHQYPTGAVMSGARRQQLVAWLRKRNAIAVEDDYDAEFRYDRAPIGALQGLDPDRVIYVGSCSKTLAPALRLGWLIAPPALLSEFEDIQHFSDNGRSRLEQHVMAEFIASGDFDRHLRKMRALYRDRRRVLIASLGKELPEAVIGGVSAGLHATVRLPSLIDEPALLDRALRRGVALNTMTRHSFGEKQTATTLVGSPGTELEFAL